MLKNKRLLKRTLAVVSTLALTFGLIPLSYTMAEPEPMEYVNEFSSLESLNDFQIHYQADPNTAPAILKEETTVHWAWDAEAGMVRRQGDLAPGVSTATLTLKDYTFKNFEATIKYRDGLTNWGWLVLCFRQNAPGAYMSQDGMGAYIDVAGQAWGMGEGGWFLGSTGRVPGYVQGQDMTMTVRVVGQKFQLFYGEDTTATPYIEHDLNEYAAADGYLSIMSAGNDSAIDYLRVKRLDDAGNVIPLTQKVTGVDPLQTRVVATGTEKSAAIGQLPKTVQAVDALGVRKTCGVTWESADYNGDAAGTYTFTGTLQPGKATPNPDDVKATVQVEVSDAAEPLDQVETWYFDTMDVFEDFTPYWFANTGDAALASVPESADAHWTVANGYTQRKRHFNALANSTILTLDTQLKDFEATLTYVDDSISWGWTVMGYREAAPGKHFQYSGAGAYFDTAGQAWFRAQLADGTITDYAGQGQKIPDYVKGQEMTVTVRVIGDKMDLFYGADTSGEPFYTQTKEDLPESGYFSLEAVGGDSILKKLTVKRYDVAQSVASVTPVSVENGTSLEDALAMLPGTVDVTDDNGDTHACAVTWSCADYDGSTEGTYTFTGALTMPNKYLSNPQNLQAQVQIAVGAYVPPTVKITRVEAVSGQTVPFGTAADAVAALLPGTVKAYDAQNVEHICQVSWSCDTYDGNTAGEYTFTGTLTMPDELTVNPDNLTASVKVTVEQEIQQGESYVNDFDSMDSLKDFAAYYLATATNDAVPSLETDLSAHWEFADGVIRRKGDISALGNDTVLVLKDYTFKNFEATLTYMDEPGEGVNWGWTVMGIRQQEKGKYFMADGTGAFFDTAGQAWLWGQSDFKHTNEDKVPGYAKGGKATITVRVVGQNIKLYFGEGTGKTLYLDKTLPDTVNAAGFLSIHVVGSASSLDKLTVTRLDDNGNPAPLAQVKEVESVETVSNVTVQGGTSKEDALAQLPGTVLVTDDLGNQRACAVTWSCDTYDANTQGAYVCEGVLTLPDDLVNPNNLKAAANVLVVKQDLVVESVGSVESIQVAYGAAKETVIELLPQKVSITDNLGNTYVVDVTWDSATYDGSASGVYAFTGTLTMPGGVVNSNRLTATAAVTVKEKPAPVVNEYVNDFDSAEDLEDFDFYYAEGDTDVGAVKETAGAHWQLNADGTITRINDVTTDGNYGGRSAIMVLKGYTFKNFEATLTYKYGSTWGWNVLGIRQDEAGKDFRWNGAGAYIDQENTVHLWGQEDLGGDKQDGSKADLPMDGTLVDKSQPITMKVRAVGNKIEIFANDKLAYSYTCDNSFVKEGYLSIQVTANDSVIDKFTVKRLDDAGNVIPMDTTEITEVKTVGNKVVPVGTSKEEALALLPGTVTVKDNAGQEQDVQVSWSCDNYNADIKGVYVFTGTLTMPDNLLTNPDNLTAKATVTVGTEEDYKLKVESVPAVEGKKVANGTSKADVLATLPESVEITDNVGGKHTLKVNWDCADYNGKVGGTYTFVGTLVLADNLTNPDNKTVEAKIEVEAYTMYVNDFNSMDDLKDFEAYFLAETSSSKKEEASAHWTVENGVLKRVNDINAAGATSNISSLVLKDYQFKNFEATLTYRDGLTNWGWTVLGFRQQTPGNFFILDGAGSYIDVAGQAHLWGFASVAGPHDGEKMAGYVQGQPVTMKVRVVNQNMKIFAGDTLLMEKTLPEDFNYEGFLSLQVVGNDSSIDRLTIVRLDDKGNPLNLDGSKPDTKPNPGTGETTRVVIPALALAVISGTAAVFCTKKRRKEQ